MKAFKDWTEEETLNWVAGRLDHLTSGRCGQMPPDYVWEIDYAAKILHEKIKEKAEKNK